jgi:hypothetical protein
MTGNDNVPYPRIGRRAAFVIGLVAAIAVAALAAGAGGAALDRSGARLAQGPPKEYTPASRPAPANHYCASGGSGLWNGRCYAACRPTHALLVIAVGRRPALTPRIRCVPRRVTRLYYGLELKATYRHEEFGPGIDTVVDTHRWRFRSNGATTLFRQCTPLLFDENEEITISSLRLRLLVDPAISCERQQRAKHAAWPRLAIYEDVSFRTDGTIVGGAFFRSRTSGVRQSTVWWKNGKQHTDPCTLASSKTEGSGPRREPVQVATREGSARFRGLEIATTGRTTPGSAVFTSSGVACPPVPEDHDDHPYTGAPNQPPLGPELVEIASASGTGFGRRFWPNLGERFGAKRIEVTRVIEIGKPKADVTMMKFTLILTRCARQAPPSGCFGAS